MSEENISNLIALIFIFLFVFGIFGGIAFVGYIAEEQKHRHIVELEKIKQGIFEPQNPKKSFIKTHLIHIILGLVLISVIAIICYVFKVPSGLTKFLIELVS